MKFNAIINNNTLIIKTKYKHNLKKLYDIYKNIFPNIEISSNINHLENMYNLVIDFKKEEINYEKINWFSISYYEDENYIEGYIKLD